ncbi:hypothetical protein L538_1854 [Bordetella hinzii 4161]|nr:hypothetical protein L538_1854 [Bordetella hinzii 4161]
MEGVGSLPGPRPAQSGGERGKKALIARQKKTGGLASPGLPIAVSCRALRA